ncbi:hypothetical protein A0H81_08944 [Grifola frondosa]|uniref:F-box domain-containing protein n=1 Tax=Grifola frondosa TaxID=5627 RepID=A0A1C7M3K2_GRIFR|nr:hypothetical protein A0H81_08944 [Grifola frondosa]
MVVFPPEVLQRASEVRLYEQMALRDPKTAYLACTSVMAHNAYRAAYVRRLWIYQDTRRSSRNQSVPLPPHFWRAIQDALAHMDNLEGLLIHDPSGSNTWVLNSPDFRFQLREASFHLIWDANMVAFLETQHKLRSLSTMDAAEEGPLQPLALDTLQSLEAYNGPVLVVAELLPCPLTHLQIAVDEETAPILPTVVADLGRAKKKLRGLNILYLPEHLVLETLQLISTSVFSSTLRHLGLLSWPVCERHRVHGCLMNFRCLAVMELDLTRWDPQPSLPMQLMLVTELHIYCSSLRHVIFWLGPHRITWSRQEDDQWTNVHLPNRHPVQDNWWRNA